MTERVGPRCVTLQSDRRFLSLLWVGECHARSAFDSRCISGNPRSTRSRLGTQRTNGRAETSAGTFLLCNGGSAVSVSAAAGVPPSPSLSAQAESAQRGSRTTPFQDRQEICIPASCIASPNLTIHSAIQRLLDPEIPSHDLWREKALKRFSRTVKGTLREDKAPT
jgi:hypothetical protein